MKGFESNIRIFILSHLLFISYIFKCQCFNISLNVYNELPNVINGPSNRFCKWFSRFKIFRLNSWYRILMRMGWQQILQIAEKVRILQKMAGIIRKKHNAVYTPEQTMKTMFKGFLQNIRIYHSQLQQVKAYISTYYRDLRKCDRESYQDAKQIMERLYLRSGRKSGWR